MYTVAQFHGKQEVNQINCKTAEEAQRTIEDGNRTAAQEWRWGLSDTNFTDDDGTPLDLEESNAIRRACGQLEY